MADRTLDERIMVARSKGIDIAAFPLHAEELEKQRAAAARAKALQLEAIALESAIKNVDVVKLSDMPQRLDLRQEPTSADDVFLLSLQNELTLGKIDDGKTGTVVYARGRNAVFAFIDRDTWAKVRETPETRELLRKSFSGTPRLFAVQGVNHDDLRALLVATGAYSSAGLSQNLRGIVMDALKSRKMARRWFDGASRGDAGDIRSASIKMLSYDPAQESA